MNRKISFLIALVIIFAAFICGCRPVVVSQVPIPAHYDLSTQQVMQSAHHWDMLADNMADATKKILDKREMTQKSVYVKPLNNTTFDKCFYQHLVKRLLAHGINVTNDCAPVQVCERDNLLLTYSTVLVGHSNRYLRDGRRSYRSLAPGLNGSNERNFDKVHNKTEYRYKAYKRSKDIESAVVGAESGKYTYIAVPNDEIVVTCNLAFNNKVLLNESTNFYIDHGDISLYVPPKKGRNYRLTDKN